jgi:acetyl esterase
LPQTLIILDENDVFRDEGEAFARKLAAAIVTVESVRYHGTRHDLMLLNPIAETPAVRGAVDQASDYLRKVFAAHRAQPHQDMDQPLGSGAARPAGRWSR